MSPTPDQRRSPRIVELPTGKTVEVSYFSPDAVGRRGAPAPPSAAPNLERCPECASNLVYPYDWDDSDERAYVLALRCPNCEWTEIGTYEWDSVRRLDERLDHGERAMMADLAALTRANVEEDFDRFIAALRDDHVWPMDF
ncbi:MAG TPA: hypothetical protein VGN78_12125 [Solirubrobacteraceae bacterium]|jgi:hypothetical protein|nr:hypothetical protein [Solirubrobacteraceae bacterium]